jgi:hypothetical protein
MAAAQSLIWILLFLFLTVVMLVLVPRQRIWELFAFGVVGGFLLALVIQYLAVLRFNWWSFNFLQFASWRGIPLFVAAMWFPSVIIFAHFLKEMKSTTTIFLYILAFGAVTTATEYALVYLGYRQYGNWNVLMTFALAVGIHSLLAGYLLYVSGNRRVELRR